MNSSFLRKAYCPLQAFCSLQSNFFYMNGHKSWVYSNLNVSDVKGAKMLSDTIFQKRVLFEHMNFLLWVTFSQSHFYHVTDKFQSIL